MAKPNCDIQPHRLRRLVQRMINIYSPSGKEKEVLDYLHGFLKRYDLPLIRQPVDERRYNLLIIPPEIDAQLVLVGHVDTVSAYDLEDFGYEEQGDEIIGLGSADMKGGCAAMIEAYLSAHQVLGRPPAGALALVVGEEEEGDGARRLVRDHHFPWAVIGEPTDLKIGLSHFGYLEVAIITRGKRRHASLASGSRNAVVAMLHLLPRITQFWEEGWPEAVVNIRDLNTSSGGFAVPDRCEVWLDVHLPPATALGEITLELEQLVADGRSRDPDLDVSLRFTEVHSGYQIPDRGPILDRFREAFARNGLVWVPTPFQSHSDANQLWSAGIKPLLLGPGRLEKAHSADESVSFAQLCQAARLYLDLLLHWEDRER